LESFRDEKIEVFTLLYPNAFDAANAIGDVWGDRVEVGFGNDSELFNDLTERMDRFDLIDSRATGLGLFALSSGGAGGIGGQGLGGGGGQGFGGGFGGQGFGGGRGGGGFGGAGFRGNQVRGQRFAEQGLRQSLQQDQEATEIDVSRLTPEDIQNLSQAQLLEDPTARRTAISRIIRRQQRATIFVTVARRQNQLIVRTSDPETMKAIQDLIEKIDVPTPLVLLEVKILQIQLGDGFNSVFDYQFADGESAAGQFVDGDSGAIVPPASDGVTQNGAIAGTTPVPLVNVPGTFGAARRAANLAVAGATGNPNMLFQVVDEHFRFRMQMLETKNRVTELASPLLLTANNEVSQLFVGREEPFNVDFSTTTTQSDAAAVTTGSAPIEFRPIGTTLFLTPNINADRTVTLRLITERSERGKSSDDNGSSILVPNGAGGFSTQDVDVVNSKKVTGTFVAKDGHAIAIGGLIDEKTEDIRSEVPVLGKMPVVGFFFRRQMTNRSRTELVIVIRPYVFNTPSEASFASKRVVNELSLHPNALDAQGTLGTFAPHEVVRPNPPTSPLQTIFRFHSVEPKTY
jgi:general secretion pathway protein D